jgi:hypothetical protein
MAEFNFSLSAEDTQRLFAIKHIQGLDNLTGNDFARELLAQEVKRLFPAIPDRDENGDVINMSAYRGQ